MIEPWKSEAPAGETNAIINCPKSGHITSDETNVNTFLVKNFLNCNRADLVTSMVSPTSEEPAFRSW